MDQIGLDWIGLELDWIGLDWIFIALDFWIRVRGVIRLRSTPNGLERDQRTKNDLRTSWTGTIGKLVIILFRPSPGPGRAGDR